MNQRRERGEKERKERKKREEREIQRSGGKAGIKGRGKGKKEAEPEIQLKNKNWNQLISFPPFFPSFSFGSFPSSLFPGCSPSFFLSHSLSFLSLILSHFFRLFSLISFFLSLFFSIPSYCNAHTSSLSFSPVCVS